MASKLNKSNEDAYHSSVQHYGISFQALIGTADMPLWSEFTNWLVVHRGALRHISLPTLPGIGGPVF